MSLNYPTEPRSNMVCRNLQIRSRRASATTVIELAGKLNSSIPAATQQSLLAFAEPDCRLVLDLNQLKEVSGVGLRILLSLFRMVRAVGGTVSTSGISPELNDLLEATGFEHLLRQASINHNGPRQWNRPAVRIDCSCTPTHSHGEFALRPGFPLPLGATQVARDQFLCLFAARHFLQPDFI